MNIGLDIDDTMTNSSELMIRYAQTYFNTTDKALINKLLHTKMSNEEVSGFYNKYLPEMMEKYELKENVKEVIDSLRTKGHKIIIITARGRTIKKGLVEITKKYLKKHKIEVDDMIFREVDKASVCLENNIDIMIDDSVAILEKVKESGIKPLLFSSINNQNISTTIDRVTNWLELEAYIDKMYSYQ